MVISHLGMLENSSDAMKACAFLREVKQLVNLNECPLMTLIRDNVNKSAHRE